MSKSGLLEVMADILELDIGQIKGEDVLSEYNNWDSLLLIRLIPLLEEEIGRKIQIYEIINARSINDILKLE